MNPLNFSTISFPFLGLEVNPGRSLDIGPQIGRASCRERV